MAQQHVLRVKIKPGRILAIEHGENFWTIGFRIEGGQEVCEMYRNGKRVTELTHPDKQPQQEQPFSPSSRF